MHKTIAKRIKKRRPREENGPDLLFILINFERIFLSTNIYVRLKRATNLSRIGNKKNF
jgi:hypothetical protein